MVIVDILGQCAASLKILGSRRGYDQGSEGGREGGGESGQQKRIDGMIEEGGGEKSVRVLADRLADCAARCLGDFDVRIFADFLDKELVEQLYETIVNLEDNLLRFSHCNEGRLTETIVLFKRHCRKRLLSD